MIRLAHATLVALVAVAAFVGPGPQASAAPAERHAAEATHAGAHHDRPHPHHAHIGHHVGHHLGRRHHLAPAATTSPAVPARHHTRVVTFVDGYVQPVIPPPYPFDGKLAGDGILGTGILGTNVLRAFGVVRN